MHTRVMWSSFTPPYLATSLEGYCFEGAGMLKLTSGQVQSTSGPLQAPFSAPLGVSTSPSACCHAVLLPLAKWPDVQLCL